MKTGKNLISVLSLNSSIVRPTNTIFHLEISLVKGFNKKRSLLRVKLSINTDIIRILYRLSWMNKSQLKKSFNSEKDSIFNK